MTSVPQLPIDPLDKGSWGERAVRVINEVLKEHAGESEAQILRACRDEYPFGERSMHPYKIWLKKIALLKKLLRGEPLRKPAAPQRKAPDIATTPLFGGVLDSESELLKKVENRDSLTTQKEATDESTNL
jgi:hypothetical protein